MDTTNAVHVVDTQSKITLFNHDRMRHTQSRFSRKAHTMRLRTTLAASLAAGLTVMMAASAFAQTGGETPFADSTLYWVVDGADSSAYDGWSAVLVRSVADGSGVLPTMTGSAGDWILENGVVQGVAQLGSAASGGEFAPYTGTLPYSSGGNISGLEQGDAYVMMTIFDPFAFGGNDSGFGRLNIDRWSSEAAIPDELIVLDPADGNGIATYHYYMFLFDTTATDGNINSALLLTGAALEETDYGVMDQVQKSLQVPVPGSGGFMDYQNALVIRFEGPFAVPEPTSAALLALGAACLAFRRRVRR